MIGYMILGWVCAWIWCRVVRRESASGVSLLTLVFGWIIGRMGKSDHYPGNRQ